MPFADGRGVKYPARKLMVVTGNKRPKPVILENALKQPLTINICDILPIVLGRVVSWVAQKLRFDQRKIKGVEIVNGHAYFVSWIFRT